MSVAWTGLRILAFASLSGLAFQCAKPAEPDPAVESNSTSRETGDPYRRLRHDLVRREIEPQVRDPLVLAAMRKVPRHLFVPESLVGSSYENRPLPIERDQTISQPVVVAMMTELLELTGKERVLEIGTGSGYQAAILAEIAAEVYSVEILPELAAKSEKLLASLGYENIQIRVGDGFQGWPEKGPFDAIIVTAAPAEVPPPLIEQLEVGGRLVIPVGERWQDLVRLRRNSEDVNDVTREPILPVRFVPMTGQAQTGKQDITEK